MIIENDERAVRLTITLPPSAMKRLLEYCKQTGLSKSGVVATALINYLNQQELSIYAVEQLLNNPAFLEKMQTLVKE